MKHADHFGFPILTFVDTPGAFAGKAAEEQGQASHLSYLTRRLRQAVHCSMALDSHLAELRWLHARSPCGYAT